MSQRLTDYFSPVVAWCFHGANFRRRRVESAWLRSKSYR